jgi:hypothetical protein
MASALREGRWNASIAITQDGVERTRMIDAKTCPELAEAAALVVAMALRTPVEEPRPDEGNASADPPAPPPLAGPERASEPAPAPGATRAIRAPAFAIGISVDGITGVLPSVAPAAAVRVAWLPGRARVELSAYATVHEDALVPSTARGTELRMLGASARGCWTFPLVRGVDVAPCAGVEGVRISSSGVGIASPHDGATWGAAGSLGARAAFALNGPLSLTLAADALAPTARPRFFLDGDPVTVLHQPAAVWGRASLGAEVRF